ncbi:porin family protein [Mesorhizobium sp. NZP2234]|uniref:outer membrane protein n=1 Tax=Mesorhizobium sp. NZP2234 TaxID=2483402 RepID=UPI001552A5BF|nr:outer membrane beta-barrel protein [Mesorhizobium sp. NZP2234]QKC91860.1 porin family protein [Mesorhizobium sp. NZP2234]
MVRSLFAASVTIAALVSVTSLSRAADQIVAPQEATGPSWTGFFVGVHGGGAFGNMGYDQLPVSAGDRTVSYKFGAADFAYGVHGGFDYQFSNRWVAGFELDYTQIDADYSPNVAGGFGTLVKAKSIYSVSGRAGYLVTPQTLVYGRLGYAGIKLDDIEQGFFDTVSKTVGAAEIGIGAETFLFGNLTGRIEANYYHPFDKFTNTDAESFDPHYLLVTAGLSYRFNAQNGSAYPVQSAPDMNWGGFYAGVDGSYNFGNMQREIDDAGSSVGPFGAQSLGAGVFAGYDVVLGSSYLIGVEAGFDYLDARFEDPAGNSFLLDSPTLFGTVKGSLSATVRAGYFATPSTLVYVKGGFAGLLTEANEDFFALDSGGNSKMLSAYQLGAGIESALTDKLSLRVEGLYTKAVDGLTVNNSQIGQVELKPSLLSGRIGLAYHF